MARASADLVFARTRADAHSNPSLFEGERLDLDAFHRLIEIAESVIEGRHYTDETPPCFHGSIVMTLRPSDLGLPQLTKTAFSRLARAIRQDPRATRVIHDRAYRELARLMGAQTPLDVDFGVTVDLIGDTLRVDIEVEGDLVLPLSAKGVN